MNRPLRRAIAAVRHRLGNGMHLVDDDAARSVLITPPATADLAGAVLLWTHLSQILVGSPRSRARDGSAHRAHLAFEYVWNRSGLQVGIWTPSEGLAESVAAAVRAAWPGSQTCIVSVQDPLPQGPETVIAGGRLRLAWSDSLPLRTDHDADPLRALLTSAQPYATGECASVQVLARTATAGQLSRAIHAAELVNAGKPLAPIARALNALTPQPGGKPAESALQLRAVLDKASYPRLETVIRYAVAGPAEDPRLQHRADAIAAAFASFTSAHNQLRRTQLTAISELISTRAFQRGDLLSVLELAGVAHLPLDTSVPGLVRAGARSIPPPPGVILTAPDQPGGTGTKRLGRSDAGPPCEIGLSVEGSRQHVHVAGATGSGKTTLLTRWILDDITAGRGVIVIDCKGDQVNDVLDRLPETAISRLHLIDPAVPAAPSGLNVLSGPDPYLAVDHLVGIFRQMYADSWGPRTDDILRSACLTLALTPDATLADVPRLLTVPAFRARVTAHLTDPILTEFWQWYDQLSKPGRAAAIGPVQNKLRALLLRPFVRAVLAQPSSVIDLGAVLDGGILLVRIPKGELGADTVRLMGSFVLSTVWEYTTHRARIGEHARRDATVYVDEVHNYLELLASVEDLLAEARAFRLGLVLAHQDLAQIRKDLREALSANARNKVYFATSPEDARAFERHIQPNLTSYDLVHLDAFQAVARLMVASALTPAFTMRTLPLPPAIAGRADQARKAMAAANNQPPQQPLIEDALPEVDRPEPGPMPPHP